MPEIIVTVPHRLPQAEAETRIRGLIEKAREEYGDLADRVEEQWTGSSCHFCFEAMGSEVKGDITVGPDAVRIKGDLPVALSWFKNKIESALERHASEALA